MDGHRRQHRHPPPRRLEREQIGAPDVPSGIEVDDRDREVAQDHDGQGQDPGHVDGGPPVARRGAADSSGERAVHRPLCTRLALIEAVVQAGSATSIGTAVVSAVHLVVFGVAQVWVFWRFGFVWMLGFRLFYYALWHVAWGVAPLPLLF